MAKNIFVLHGMWVAIEYKTYLEICLPDMPSHMYLAGPWLGEFQLPDQFVWDFRPYLGEQTPPATFADHNLDSPHPIVACGNPDLDEVAKCPRRILLPYPKELAALTAASSAEPLLTIIPNPPTPRVDHRKIGVCFGLVYEHDQNTARDPLPPDAADLFGIDLPVVMHIYATAGSAALEKNHADEERRKVKKLFPNIRIKPGVKGDALAPTFIPGVARNMDLTEWETLTFSQRQDALQGIGADFRRALRSVPPSSPAQEIRVRRHGFGTPPDGSGHNSRVLECSPYAGRVEA